MSLASILYPSPGVNGWKEWLHAHVRHHEALIDSLNATFDASLSLTGPLWPVDVQNENEMRVWNRVHLDAHNNMNDLLGIPGQDISAPNFKDPDALDAWIYLHFTMHQAAANRCGFPV